MQQSHHRIQQLRQLLAGVSRFQYVSEPGPASVMGWAGEGRGAVRVEAETDLLLFHESGHFYPQQGNEIAMFNCFEWGVTERGMRLSHRRRGEAVFLFDLVPDENSGSWVSEQPHLCGDDIYQGRLDITATGITLSWRVTGPRKDEYFNYHYC